MIFKLVAKLFHDADGGHGCGVAERTKCAAQHVRGKIADKADVFRPAVARVKTVQSLLQPGGSFAAGNAPAAGFMGVEVHDAASHVHHASIFVDDHHAAGTEHRAGLSDGVVVHGDIDFVGLEHRAGTATGND